MSTPKILAMRVDMMYGLGNQPRLLAVLDRRPVEFHFDNYSLDRGTAYVGWSDHGKGPWSRNYTATANQAGLGGAEVEMTMRDGSRQTIKGPWIGSGVIEECTSVPVMDVDYRALDEPSEPSLQEVYESLDERLARLSQLNYHRLRYREGSNEMQELEDKVQYLHGLVYDDAARHRFLERSSMPDRLRRKHHQAMYQRSPAFSLGGPQRRSWENTEAQQKLAAEVLLWEGGISRTDTLTCEAAREALDAFCPGFTIYPKRWRPSAHGPRHPYWVPAPKSSAKALDGCDVPAPKEDGWWGYAVHDEHGYPLSAFYESLKDLLLALPGPLEKGWAIGARSGGKWSALSRDQQVKVARRQSALAQDLVR